MNKASLSLMLVGVAFLGGAALADDEDEAGQLRFSQASFNVSEDDGVAVVTVRRHKGESGDVSVEYATGDGSAVAGEDYEETFGVLTWSDGDDGDRSFEVPLIDDDVAEGLETVRLVLSNPTGGASIHSQRGRSEMKIRPSDRGGDEDGCEKDDGDGEDDEGGCEDDDAAGVFKLSQASFNVHEDIGAAVIRVERSRGEDGEVSVDYETSEGTARAGEDYTASSGTLTWDDGDDETMEIIVPIIDDELPEGLETVRLVLSNPTGGASLHPQRARSTLRIVPNDGGPGDDELEDGAGTIKLASRRIRVSEGAGAVMVSVDREGGKASMVTVDFATAPGSALEGSDYEAVAGTLVWEDGEASDKAFLVNVLDDEDEEGREHFNVFLSHPTGGAKLAAGRSAAQVQIIDDDGGRCLASDTALCLLGGRFRVDATWRTPDGAAGVAHNKALSDQAGLLSFFDEDNAEVLIKMLDGCGVSGLEGYWVFFATTTNLELALTVTDTASGKSKAYAFGQGEVGLPVLDVSSFRDCP